MTPNQSQTVPREPESIVSWIWPVSKPKLQSLLVLDFISTFGFSHTLFHSSLLQACFFVQWSQVVHFFPWSKSDNWFWHTGSSGHFRLSHFGKKRIPEDSLPLCSFPARSPKSASFRLYRPVNCTSFGSQTGLSGSFTSNKTAIPWKPKKAAPRTTLILHAAKNKRPQKHLCLTWKSKSLRTGWA